MKVRFDFGFDNESLPLLWGEQEMEFRFAEEEDASDYCTRLSAKAHHYDPEHGAYAQMWGGARQRCGVCDDDRDGSVGVILFQAGACAFAASRKMQKKKSCRDASPRLSLPLSAVLVGDWLLTKFEPAAIAATMDLFTPRNCRIVRRARLAPHACPAACPPTLTLLVTLPAAAPECTSPSCAGLARSFSLSQDFLSHSFDLDALVAAGATRATEPWFNVPFCYQTVSPELLARWEKPEPSPLLALPPKNEYIPRDFSLRGPAAAAAKAAAKAAAAGEPVAAPEGAADPPALLSATDRRVEPPLAFGIPYSSALQGP